MLQISMLINSQEIIFGIDYLLFYKWILKT